jgi:phage terminase large subunit
MRDPSKEIFLDIKTPRWSLPLLEPARYYGLRGGRGSGKSHYVAESRIEDLVLNPDHRGVCIRQVQTSIKFSSKQLLADKIKSMGLSHLFVVGDKVISRVGGDGFIIFQGMQDHTADSIKSLEGFNWAWVEEAQKLSKLSLELLRPTIRAEKSQLWFTWNTKKKTDPVDNMFLVENPKGSIFVHVNYTDNPFCPQSSIDEAEACRKVSLEDYMHIWLGGYQDKSEALIFKDRVSVQDFVVDRSFGHPLQGLDFGFSQDPTAAVRAYLPGNNKIYISHEFGGTEMKLDETADLITDGGSVRGRDKKMHKLPGIKDFPKYNIYEDCATPASINYLKRHGFPRIS